MLATAGAVVVVVVVGYYTYEELARRSVKQARGWLERAAVVAGGPPSHRTPQHSHPAPPRPAAPTPPPPLQPFHARRRVVHLQDVHRPRRGLLDGPDSARLDAVPPGVREPRRAAHLPRGVVRGHGRAGGVVQGMSRGLVTACASGGTLKVGLSIIYYWVAHLDRLGVHRSPKTIPYHQPQITHYNSANHR